MQVHHEGQRAEKQFIFHMQKYCGHLSQMKKENALYATAAKRSHHAVCDNEKHNRARARSQTVSRISMQSLFNAGLLGPITCGSVESYRESGVYRRCDEPPECSRAR